MKSIATVYKKKKSAFFEDNPPAWLLKMVKNPKTGNMVQVRSLDPEDQEKYRPKKDVGSSVPAKATFSKSHAAPNGSKDFDKKFEQMVGDLVPGFEVKDLRFGSGYGLDIKFNATDPSNGDKYYFRTFPSNSDMLRYRFSVSVSNKDGEMLSQESSPFMGYQDRSVKKYTADIAMGDSGMTDSSLNAAYEEFDKLLKKVSGK